LDDIISTFYKICVLPLTEQKIKLYGMVLGTTHEVTQCTSDALAVSDTTVVPVISGHSSRCPYIAGVPSSEGQFNVKRQNGS
jgi:hypothetical protein